MENDLDLIIMPRYLLPKALIAYDCTEVISIFEKVEEGTIGEPTPAGINNHYRYYFNDEIEDTQEAPRKEEIESILNLYLEVLLPYTPFIADTWEQVVNWMLFS